MLYEKLEQSFPEVGSEIILEIEQKGLVRGAEIDYESCAEFQPVAEKFAKRKNTSQPVAAPRVSRKSGSS